MNGNDDVTQTISPTNSIEDVAQIDTELNLILLEREHSKQIRPLLYSKATVNRSIQFHKFRPISSKKDITIPISVMYQNDVSNYEEDNISVVKTKRNIFNFFILISAIEVKIKLKSYIFFIN